MTYLLQIKLGLAGWKSRFYREKFGVERFNEAGNLKNDMVMVFLMFSVQINFHTSGQWPVGTLKGQHLIVLTFFVTCLIQVQKYIEGLCWVLLYYFADVPSWSWYD